MPAGSLQETVTLPNKVNMHIQASNSTSKNVYLRETLAMYKSVDSAMSVLATTGNNPNVQ